MGRKSDMNGKIHFAPTKITGGILFKGGPGKIL